MGELSVGQLEVRRTARYAVLGEEARDPRELWIVVHGYRQLAHRFVRSFRTLDDGTRCIVAPEALSRFYLDDTGGPHGPRHRVGASWMTHHDREREIADYVAYLDDLVALHRERIGPEPRLVALGFSQGAHTVARWVAAGGTPPPATTVLWGAPLPTDLDPVVAPPRLRATQFVLVRGRADATRSAEGEQAEAETLQRWGVTPRIIEHDEGHEVVPAWLRRLTSAGPRRIGS